MKKSHWTYSGDVNLEYGGTYYNLDSWRWGYVTAVRVTDLGSATGATGCYLIEHVTINVGKGWSKGKQRVKAALSSVGWSPLDMLTCGSLEGQKCMLAEAFLSYGCYDPDDGWDGYAHYHTEVIAIGREAESRDWRIDTRLRRNASLKHYVERNHL